MKKPFFPLSQCALLVPCLMAGMAHAQSIELTGDTTATGHRGASYTTDSMTVGNTAAGALDVSSGAVLINTGPATLGAATSGSGTATLSGSSQWTSAELNVGNAGTGVLNINSGGLLVSADAYIGREAGSNGTVTVDGPGSNWSSPVNQ
ncbi:hypothetical protein HS961_16880 [Comamonas piscis]|uniref:Autotransporter outer membrane beta-barrel domain-containing protein n=1 Tax=Comamonas piscis TaxID=1562974 RepID=A0A7G5EP86_9BURK|nr:hypothetical protein [Comamonas piscis]QMV75811.1 hypothetical protein HS961_16880 [Comamonas piscis]WSO32822.1 hypothetical protein VUJ63_16930 [Comamonas piscis]